MTVAQRARRRRASTMVASLAIAAGLMAGLASPAAAASKAKFLGADVHQSQDVHGMIGGSDRELRAGLFDLVIDGEVESQAYCIDINTPIANGAMLDEVDWATSGVANLDEVEAILRHYHPNGIGPEGHELTGSDKDMASATQAAIWHYTDGFQMHETTDENSQTVIDNYKAILAAVEGGLEGFGQPTVTLSVTPPASTEGTADEMVGPYVVNTSADSATLTASDGVTLHNEDGSPFTDVVVDGTQVWLSSDEAGEGTITATAQAEVGAGRVFFTEGQQRLVLASTVTTDASAEAPVSFRSAPTPSTTTSSVPDETTTTAPSTTTTVVSTTSTTPVPAVPAVNSGGGLPVTGAQSLVLVGVALILLALGAGFRIVSRRHRLER